mmetsp:Transcript_104292/g.185390  ORF Transcript_104292/g.185390 Transcript_104292/m.185390 type:complete len:524 (-) Transcript_104292:146-1717(-)|eukprot:CAMPEP_0197622620 /NCGR_PEP_ID=MMETSP1338-20131121/2847_1 /TAXON_ID=43686 ORGANISM="Pelagodinium beii, Strain RCC1491" /NCGR_SAMPLE_ID=MMETSP1338 /ASSEMBLY_ACC=CAM_ASM_000754 /LENGTH=523 /DNA_ID=CAMNT_0043192363 /DNA_START=64 /DNA_END=1635 /DNA_ORIENTATION=+
MGRSVEITPGLCYNLCNVESSVKLSVQAQGCPPGQKAIRFRLLPAGGYLRICQDGRADKKGGGGGLCYFTPEVHESGLLQFSRGQYALSTANGDITAVTASGDSLSKANLWAVDENQSPEGPPLKACFLRYGALQFGPFQREDFKEGVIRLQTSDARYLRITPASGMVDAAGGGGPPCQFKIQKADHNHFTLRSEHDPFQFLGVTANGALTGRDVASENQVFCWESFEQPLGKLLAPPSLIGKHFDEAVDLTLEQRKTFMEDGFLIIKGVVPPSLASAALAAINCSLLKVGATVQEEEGNIRHCADIASSDTILSLLYGTPLWTIAQRLLGRGCVAGHGQGQIALRPPNLNAVGLEEDASIPPKQWHIDGMYKAELDNSPFSLLVGVALSDQTLPNSGNLIAFAGSHHILQPMVQQEAAVPGTHPFLNQKGVDEGKPELRNGQQILLGIGDVVLLHQKTAHRVGINCSSNIRYQTYFRLKHIDHAAHLADGSVHAGLWRQYHGLQAQDDVVAQPCKKQQKTQA